MSKVLSHEAMSLMAVSHTAHDKISWNALWDYIAELESAQRWRVVADGELPEFGTSILFYDSILEKINKGTCTALDRDKTNLQWITDDGLYYHGNRCEYITHWMPLPKLPKEREE